MFSLDSGWSQIIGKRDYQQDIVGKLIFDNGLSLFLLSDGMGGAVHGEVASQKILDGYFDSFCNTDEPDLPKRLQHALSATDDLLAQFIMEHPDHSGMGGTLISTAIFGEDLYWVSVGDSPLWLLRQGRLTRLNANHSFKQELQKAVESGNMTLEEALSHPQRNELTSVVMGMGIPEVDEGHITLENGDVVLLASDGVETLSDEEIVKFCELNAGESATFQAILLMQFIDQKGVNFQDNATVQIIRCMIADTQKNN